MNGKLAWKADLGKFGTVGMGTGTSPMLFENLVILQCDEENGRPSFIVALDKKTGKEAWRCRVRFRLVGRRRCWFERQAHRTDYQRNRSRHCLRSGHRERNFGGIKASKAMRSRLRSRIRKWSL